MSLTYLINPEDNSRITIQAANNLRKELTATVVDHPLATLETASDHIVVKPKVFSVSGTITEAYFGGNEGYLTPVEFDAAIERLISRRVPFKFYLEESTFLNVPDSVFLVGYTAIKTEREGNTSYSANFKFREILKGELAQTTKIPLATYNKLVTKKKDVGSQSTSEATSDEKKAEVSSTRYRKQFKG